MHIIEVMQSRFIEGGLLDSRGKIVEKNVSIIDESGYALVQDEWLFSQMTDLELEHLANYFQINIQNLTLRVTPQCALSYNKFQEFLCLNKLQRLTIRRLVREILLGVPLEKLDYFYKFEAPKLYSNNQWIISLVSESSTYRQHLIKEIVNMYPERSMEKINILSVGSGDGRFEFLLKENGFHVIGLELNEDNLQKSQELGITTLQGDAHNMSQVVEHNIFDLLLFSEVIGSFGIKKVMIESHKVLKPGGRILITTYEMPDYQSMKTAADPIYRDTYQYNKVARNVIKRNLESAGFQGYQVHTFSPNSTDDEKFKDITMDMFIAHKFNV